MPLYVVTVTKRWTVRVNASDPRAAREEAMEPEPEHILDGEERVVCRKVLAGKGQR